MSYEELPDLWARVRAQNAEKELPKPVSNHAAWQKEKQGPLVVDEAPIPVPKAGEILVKVGAIAMQPADWIVRDTGLLLQNWPLVMGCETAGTVVAVGTGVKQVQNGDRVFGLANFLWKGDDHGAFQEYMVMDWPVFSRTPDNVTDAEAATISVGTATSADGLFRGLELDWPQPHVVKPKEETVIVWGGSSSVGAWGIQMLVAAGYDVVTTCSPKNFDFCRGIGARHAVDYNSATVVEELIDAVKGRKVAGALGALSNEQSIQALCRIIASVPNAVKHVISVYPGGDKWAVEDVKISFAEMNTVCHSELGVHLWGRYLPQALANGRLQIKPEPEIVGQGLDSIGKALDTVRAGVSATKIVVTL